MIHGFEPIAKRDANVLILGSIPSVLSLQQHAYYAHPRNQFWWIIGNLLQQDLCQLSFAQRYRILKDNKIALWDVLTSCERQGSLDSAIVLKQAKINDFRLFLTQHTQLSAIFCNGATAYQLFIKRVVKCQAIKIPVIKLPSSSPAYASLSREAKLAQWQCIKEYRR